MKAFVFLAAASLALAACGGGASDADGGSDAAADAVQLANGMPAYTGFVDADATGETTDADSKKHEVVYTSAGSPAEIYDFYNANYADADYGLSGSIVTFGSDETGFGGYVQVFNQADEVMVHVSPKKGSGEFSATTQLGDGFPLYPGVDAADYDIRPRSDGSRMVIFRLAEDPEAIRKFYLDAGIEAGLTVDSVYFDGSSDTERVTVRASAGDDSTKVTATQFDKSE